MNGPPGFCPRHGPYTPALEACPECQRDFAATTRPGQRPSQLETQRPVEAGPTARPAPARHTTRDMTMGGTTARDVGRPTADHAAVTARDVARTTAQGQRATARDARATASNGGRASQLETQRPRFAPIALAPAEPESTRLHGFAALGLVALTVLLGYRQCSMAAQSSGAQQDIAPSNASSAVHPTLSGDAGAAPGLASATTRVSLEPEPEGRNTSGDVRWPPIRHRAIRGAPAEICNVAWTEMYRRDAAGDPAPGPTPLMMAAESGELGDLQDLLAGGAQVDERDALGHTALMYAASRGRNAQAEALLRAGADARTRGLFDAAGGSRSALDAALIGGHHATAQLIERYVLRHFVTLDAEDLTAIDEAGDTPLHWVARYGGPDAAELLLQRGADPELTNCASRPGDERGLHRDDPRGATPLLVAVWAGSPEVVHTLLAAKASAKALDERRRGVFHLVRDATMLGLTAELISAGADPTLADRDGKTAADALSNNGLRLELERALAAAGRPIGNAPPGIADLIGVIRRLGKAPGPAPEDDPAEVLAVIDTQPLLVTEADARGRTALAEAAELGLPRVAESLIARGARVDARDASGATPLHRARDAATVTALLKLGADIDARDRGGATPLHWRAATPGSLGAVSALVQAGANPRHQDRAGRTALDLARESGSPDVVAHLENN